jgi:hypothetical protein
MVHTGKLEVKHSRGSPPRWRNSGEEYNGWENDPPPSLSGRRSPFFWLCPTGLKGEEPLNLIEQFENEGIHIRPEVKRHYAYFLSCVKHYGADVVKKVLDTGRNGKLRLTFLKNKKDRYQMMQLLDLV